MAKLLTRAKSATAPGLSQERNQKIQDGIDRLDNEADIAFCKSLYQPLFVIVDVNNDNSVSFQELMDTAMHAYETQTAAMEAIEPFWVAGGTPEEMNRDDWVKAWNAHLKGVGAERSKDLMLGLLIAANESRDMQDPLQKRLIDMEDLITQTQTPEPDSKLKLKACPETLSGARDLFRELDFLGTRGSDDVLSETEIRFLQGAGFRNVFAELDSNNDGMVSFEEWQTFWEARLQRQGQGLTSNELNIATRRIRRLKGVIAKAHSKNESDWASAIEDADMREARDRSQLMCMAAAAVAAAAAAIGATVWFTRKE